MHLVVDAVAVQEGSAGIVVEHLLAGWTELAPADRVTVLAPPAGPAFRVPAGVAVETLTAPLPGPAGRLWLRSVAVRRAARRLRADAVLSGVPASGLLGTRCPRGIILYDLRHELRPHQFSRATRLARRVSWGWSMASADGIFTISERTLGDLRRRHPRHAGKARAAVLGSDHALAWPPADPARPEEPPYALAFGHFANKNADAVIAGWAAFCRTDDRWHLRLVGMGAADRAAAEEQVARLGVADRVTLMPWLDDEAFARCFTGAGLVVFPSDFEGFGLPAAEASAARDPDGGVGRPGARGGHRRPRRDRPVGGRRRPRGGVRRGDRADAGAAGRRPPVRRGLHLAPHGRGRPRRPDLSAAAGPGQRGNR
ncbi:glycosyltransferase [Nocardioides sp. TF02-7]|uniref:glycosyltransferase n=1 Tax=Nocardioides sp. TF02-7 TaxID=2917724 RepID=UPI001F05B488|nr:glycosyltransferase [Nocardioides sp. TF02-7]UMG91115.1 glycosyltransferase [Nocardioides sp. TF02-7]